MGGISGLTTVLPVDNAQCYATITAIGKEGKVGMIMGNARTDAIKATNCYVGGTLVLEEKEEWTEETPTNPDGELITVYSPGTITASNYLSYIYSTAVTKAVADGDGCTADKVLTAKPEVPVYTYTPAK